MTFEPRIKLAKAIQKSLGEDLHSMIDISDGLAQDLEHLTNEKCSIKLDTKSLPLRTGATIKGALGDGEDYELLFTCTSPPKTDEVTVIGKVVERCQSSVIDYMDAAIDVQGWQHV